VLRLWSIRLKRDRRSRGTRAINTGQFSKERLLNDNCNLILNIYSTFLSGCWLNVVDKKLWRLAWLGILALSLNSGLKLVYFTQDKIEERDKYNKH
jgi:hypothetical protein